MIVNLPQWYLCRIRREFPQLLVFAWICWLFWLVSAFLSSRVQWLYRRVWVFLARLCTISSFWNISPINNSSCSFSIFPKGKSSQSLNAFYSWYHPKYSWSFPPIIPALSSRLLFIHSLNLNHDPLRHGEYILLVLQSFPGSHFQRFFRISVKEFSCLYL